MLFRTGVIRALVAVACATLCLLLVPQTATANPKYASIVIDAASGEVLRERYADKRLYPASLTKMMTLYLVFEAVEAGKLNLDEKIRVSATAARTPYSKLKLTSGSRIRLRDAIQATATNSSNDMATALAETVAGSERAFARQMTRKARALGMKNTTFKNAHGLPDRQQKSTARDMAILGKRLIRDFPQYYKIFERKSFTYRGRKMRATNKLLSKYKGMDGIKTGYTRASGFNLVASAERNGNRIIGVVFGGKSGPRRDRHMKRILDEGFDKLERLQRDRAIAFSPVPRPKPTGGRQSAPMLAAAPAAPAMLPVAAPQQPAALVAMRRNGDRSVVLEGMRALERVLPNNSGVRVIRPRPVMRPSGDWAVQIGAYRKRSQAESILEKANRLKPPQLNGANPVVDRRLSGGRPMYRARFSGLARGQAENACRSFSARGFDCFAVRGGS